MKSNKFKSIKSFFWDPQTRICMGRTGDSWFKLIAFYITLYSCLAALWSLYYYLFHLTISDKYPKWQLEESLIGSNPGLGMRPQSPRHRVESALISFKQGLDGDYKHWVDDINDYVQAPNKTTTQTSEKSERNSNEQPNTKTDCSLDREFKETICPFDSSSMPVECTAAQNYSFPEGKPCLLMKLNRIYGWKPEAYTERPENYPTEAPFTAGNIQITCEGQHDPDKEHIGPIEYHPSSGLELKYYPYLNQPGYQSPFVMVHFKDPKLNTLIYIECKAWAKNIEHDRYNRKGMVSFELFIEKPSQVH